MYLGLILHKKWSGQKVNFEHNNNITWKLHEIYTTGTKHILFYSPRLYIVIKTNIIIYSLLI